ncbi:hypothetical protein [Onishia niordana]|uniref:hypothetical protein n=1 Tax=Onishia niordana TaxID=2508711 RepID=UPI0010A00BE8|nr:hypothetical protein [Halomonas niordiana]
MPRIAMISLASLSYIYCLGYVSFFGYFGWVSGDAWWLNIPAKDLLVRGVFSLLLTKAWWGFLLFVVFLFSCFYYKEIDAFYKGNLKHRLFREWVVWGAVFCGVAAGTVSSMPGSLLDIMDNEKANVSKMIEEGEPDLVCLVNSDECVKGKVLYSNSDVYVLYVGGYENGGLRVVNRSLVERIDLGWPEAGRNAIQGVAE